MSSRIPPAAFEYYVGLGTMRSHRAVAEKYGVSKRAVTKLAVREEWAGRLAAIEAEAREKTDKRLVSELAEMHERNIKMVKLTAARALEGLSRFSATTAADTARFTELAFKLGRLMAGEPSERTAVSVEEVTRREVQDLLTTGDPSDDDDW